MRKSGEKTIQDVPTGLSPHLSTLLVGMYELIAEKGYIRNVPLAERLGIGRPNVTQGIKKLEALGLVNYERYRGVTLSDSGIKAAQEALARIETIHRFLEAAGARQNNFSRDARLIATVANDDILTVLKAATSRLRK